MNNTETNNYRHPKPLSTAIEKKYQHALELVSFHQGIGKKIFFTLLLVLVVSSVELFIFYEWFLSRVENADGYAPIDKKISSFVKALVILGIFKAFFLYLMMLWKSLRVIIAIAMMILTGYFLIHVGNAITIPVQIQEITKHYKKFEKKESQNKYKPQSKNIELDPNKYPNVPEEQLGIMLAQMKEAQKKKEKPPHPLIYTEKSSWHMLARDAYIKETNGVKYIALITAMSSAFILLYLTKLNQIQQMRKEEQMFIGQHQLVQEKRRKYFFVLEERKKLDGEHISIIRAGQMQRVNKYIEGATNTDTHVKYYMFFTRNEYSWKIHNWFLRYVKGIVHVNPHFASPELIKQAYDSTDKLVLATPFEVESYESNLQISQTHQKGFHYDN